MWFVILVCNSLVCNSAYFRVAPLRPIPSSATADGDGDGGGLGAYSAVFFAKRNMKIEDV